MSGSDNNDANNVSRSPKGLSRRKFLLGSAATAAGVAVTTSGITFLSERAEAFFNMGAFWKRPAAGNGQTSNGYTIGQSLRFNSARPAYLELTPSTASGNSTFFISVWLKRGLSNGIGSNFEICSAYSGGTGLYIRILSTGELQIQNYAGTVYRKSAALYRDPSAWGHLFLSFNSSSSIDGYWNGTAITWGTTNSLPASYDWNNNVKHRIGCPAHALSDAWEGYMAEFISGSGAALPTVAGQIDINSGQWIPKKYSGAYGSQGYYLNFSNSANLGQDSSGNNNHWSGGAAQVSQSFGTALGTMVQNGGLAAAFDGVIGTPYAVDGQANNPKTIGKDWGAGNTKIITKFSWYGMYNGTYLAGATIKLQGSTDNFSSSIVDLYSGTVVGTDTETITASATVTSTGYRYHRVAIYTNAQVDTAEVQFFEAALQTYDQVLDSPTNNFCTWSPIDGVYSGQSSFNGNLAYDCSSPNAWGVFGTFSVSSGKWYWETWISSNKAGVSARCPGVFSPDTAINHFQAYPHTVAGAKNAVYDSYLGRKNVDAAGFSAYGASWTVGDIIGVALDCGNRQITFYKNNVSQGSISLSASVTNWTPYEGNTGDYNTSGVNFGQGGQTGLTYDAASGGRFKYTPPAGFKALCTANLSSPTIKNPSSHFRAVLDTGANIKSTCETQFTYFFEWIKDRANANNHQIIDTVRGTTAVIHSNDQAAETTYTAPSGNSVGWIWNLNGPASSNNSGSVTTQVAVNSTAGISAFTFSASNISNPQTVGHGLGTVPAFFWFRGRSGTHFGIYHQSLGATQYLNLTTGVATTSAVDWNNTAPTSTVITLGSWFFPDPSNTPYIAMAFAEVAGFSKFGSYTGNGNADGPFVYCGFKPRWIMYKRTDTAGYDWFIHDGGTSTYNPTPTGLWANSSAAEYASLSVDMLSNGFKIRVGLNNTNASGGTYIFAAFAEAPFKYATAR